MFSIVVLRRILDFIQRSKSISVTSIRLGDQAWKHTEWTIVAVYIATWYQDHLEGGRRKGRLQEGRDSN
jgi:hypothetical protein